MTAAALLLTLVLAADPRGSVIVDRHCTGAIVAQKGNTAYVLSAGHCFQKSITAAGAKKEPVTVRVFVPHGEVPREYKGKLLCARWEGDVCDGALISFHTKGRQHAYKLAPEKFKVEAGMELIAFGRDGGLKIVERRTTLFDRAWHAGCDELTTVKGAAIGGDSGGPLLTPDGLLLGICSRSDRSYKTFWSSWRQLRKWLTGEGYGWVVK